MRTDESFNWTGFWSWSRDMALLLGIVLLQNRAKSLEARVTALEHTKVVAVSKVKKPILPNPIDYPVTYPVFVLSGSRAAKYSQRLSLVQHGEAR